MMRRVSSQALWSILACTGVLAVGCADSPTAGGGSEPVVRVLQGQAQTQPSCVDHASPGQVAIRWLDAGKDPVNKSKDISVVLKNPSQHPVTLWASASASGPGRKERRLALGTHTLASGEEKTLAILVAALPIQSTELSAELRVQVELVDSGGSTRTIGSQPVFYHFAQDGKTAVVYGAEAMAKSFHGGVLNGNAFGASGKIKGDGDTWEEVAAMVADEKDPDFNVGFAHCRSTVSA